jgi:hypothetical protein
MKWTKFLPHDVYASSCSYRRRRSIAMRSILLFSLLAAAANAATIPGFRLQEVDQTLSTDLIKNCGDSNDILT